MNLTSRNNYQIFNWFFPAYYIIIFGQASGFVPLSGYVMVPIFAVLFYYGFKYMHLNYNKNKLLLYFIIYNLFTVTSYLFIDRPISLFFNDCVFFLIPILISFLGMDRRQVSNKFYDIFFWSSFISLVIGYYIYFVRPPWYMSFYTKVLNSTWFHSQYIDTNDILESYRFSSFAADSYFTEYIGMFVFSLGLVKMFRSSTNKLLLMFFNLIILGAVLLSLQRAAIASCCLMIGAYFLYYLFNRKGKNKGNLRYILCTFFILGFIAVALGTSEVVEKVLFRFTQMGASDAFEVEGSRTEQIQTTLASWENYVTGNGLGTASSRARLMGYPGISDGNYIKLLVEEGVVGFSIFMILMVSTLIRALKNFKYLSMECCVLGALMFTMLGSGSLMFTYYIIPYWYAIGKVWNPDYLNHLKSNNISI